MAQISYTDKVALNINADIPDYNKVTAEDMNEIKSVVNENYDEVVPLKNYSTTEKVVGTWIDDKPIYRKILTNVTISLTNDAQDIPHGISNFSDLVDLKIKAKYGSTTYDLLSSGYIVKVTGTNIIISKMTQGINLNSYVMTIIIEYTKTTN